MAFTPVRALADQEEAFRLIYAAFTGKLPSRFPEQEALKDPDSGLRWEWRTVPKPGKPETRLVKSDFFSRSGSRIGITVPLSTIDVNALGLIACDHAGRRFLCRQKIPNEARADATDKEAFADGWTGKSYPRFPVTGLSSARYYYAIISLDDGAEAILNGINDLLDGKKRLASR